MKNSEDVRQNTVSGLFGGVSGFVLSLFYIVVSLVFRWPSFFPSVIDHDESTYILVARELLGGARLYDTVWDNKPPGIFLLFAVLQYLFGQEIWPVRVFGTLAVAATAFFVDRSVRALGGSSREALFGGLTTALLFSMHRSGLAANTELFFLPLIVAGVWLLVAFPRFGLLGTAFLCGVGALFKPVTLFDFSAFWMVGLMAWSVRCGAARPAMIALIGAPFLFVMPYLTLFAAMPLLGDRTELLRILFVLPGRYRQEYAEVSWFLVGTLLLFAVRFAWIAIPFVRRVVTLWQKERGRAMLPIFWSAAVVVTIFVPGKFFDHYFLHLIPALAIFAAPELVRLWDKGSRVAPRLLWVVGLLLTSLFFIQTTAFLFAPDIPRRIAADIVPALVPGDTVFADERLQIIPYLLGTPLTNRYAHPTLLTKPAHNRALGVDGEREMMVILAKKPHYLVIGDRFRFRHLIDSSRAADYRVVARYPGIRGGETLLYRREGP